MSPPQYEVELLNAETIKSTIELENLHYLSRLEILNSVNSTNTFLLEQAKLGAPSGTVCLAEQQTEGRGRLGRQWFSPPGSNIYCSLLWSFSSMQKNLSALSLVIAVTVLIALKKYGVTANIQLKWPNDILVGDRKLAGILLESLPEKNNIIPVVMGMGINMQLPPETTDYANRIDLHELMQEPISRNYFAGLLINELFIKLKIFQQQGFRPFIDIWRSHNRFQNEEVTIETPQEKIIGVMQDINEEGELLLQCQGGEVRRFVCGEVSLRK